MLCRGTDAACKHYIQLCKGLTSYSPAYIPLGSWLNPSRPPGAPVANCPGFDSQISHHSRSQGTPEGMLTQNTLALPMEPQSFSTFLQGICPPSLRIFPETQSPLPGCLFQNSGLSSEEMSSALNLDRSQTQESSKLLLCRPFPRAALLHRATNTFCCGSC